MQSHSSIPACTRHRRCADRKTVKFCQSFYDQLELEITKNVRLQIPNKRQERQAEIAHEIIAWFKDQLENQIKILSEKVLDTNELQKYSTEKLKGMNSDT